MPPGRSWSSYPLDYRAREMRILAGWIQAGLSGTVVGSAGIGKSNLLGFLCNRPDAVDMYLPSGDSNLALVAVDLNNLPSNDTSTLYRVILRSFYESKSQFEPKALQLIATLYSENRVARDPFLPHSALRELLFSLQEQGVRVVLVLDRFDWFCENVSPEMTDTLRGLRDSFKASICYIVGMRQKVTYLSDPAVLGELYEILDTYVCWVQPMEEVDARKLIVDETGDSLSEGFEADIEQLLGLTGGYPALLKACCHWWLNAPGRSRVDWIASMIDSPSIQYRLEKIWRSLTMSEQQVLGEISARQIKYPPKRDVPGELERDRDGLITNEEQRKAIDLLVTRGLIEPAGAGWLIRSSLIAAYVGAETEHSPGAIWLDDASGILHQGKLSLDNLTPLEYRLLAFLVRHPRVRHTHTDLIESAWPEDTISEGVSTEALYQVVRGLRRKIEPMPSRPRYVVNWRGTPEGGYQCFPEGRPG